MTSVWVEEQRIDIELNCDEKVDSIYLSLIGILLGQSKFLKPKVD